MAVAAAIPMRTSALDSRSLIYTLVMVVIAFLVLFPIFTLLVNSFQVNEFTEAPAYGLSNWAQVFDEDRLSAAITNTISLAFTRQLIALFFGVIIAWLIARTNLPISSWVEVGFWIALFMPALPVTMSWVLMGDPNFGVLNRFLVSTPFFDEPPINIYSYGGIVWLHLMTATLAIKIFLLVPAFRGMDAALEDAARTCGAPLFHTLFKIVVPIMMPTIIVVILLGLIRSMQAFEIELILGGPNEIDVYSTIIYRAVQDEPPLFGIGSVMAMLFLATIVPFVVLQQWYSASRSHASISSKFSNRIQDLGGLRWPLFIFISILLLFMTVVPFVMLLTSSFLKVFGMWNLTNPWTFDNWIEAFDRGDIVRALESSLSLGITASVVGMITFSFLAYIVVKTDFYGRRILDFLTWLPAVIPGLVLGFGLLRMFAGVDIFKPIYGTMSVLVIAVVIGTLALGTQIIKTSLLRLGPELEEASWAAGASRFYTFRRVVLPLIAPSVAVIGLEVFAAGVSVVGLVALLGTGDNRPLSIVQLIYLENGTFEPAAVIGIIIMSLTVSAALLARYIGLKAGLGKAES
ncbi:MAG: iron ABC transporter permease [Proteobacteria bacterium]|nr:iron ABC transporter permease [Pseudomonadota bacterium]